MLGSGTGDEVVVRVALSTCVWEESKAAFTPDTEVRSVRLLRSTVAVVDSLTAGTRPGGRALKLVTGVPVLSLAAMTGESRAGRMQRIL